MDVQPDYNKIITNAPIDGMLEYFVSAMKISERDYFCSPKTFVKGLFDEINNLSKQFSDDFEKQKAYYLNEINNTCSYEGVYYQLHGINKHNATEDDKQKAKEYNFQRTNEYLDRQVSEFKEVAHKKEIKDQYILMLLKQVDELMKIKEDETLQLSDLIDHDNRFDIVEGIKSKYKNIGGKRLKLLLMALQELDLIPKYNYNSKFHDCCRKEFNWDIKSYQAMNDYRYSEQSDHKELESIKEHIKTLMNTKQSNTMNL